MVQEPVIASFMTTRTTDKPPIGQLRIGTLRIGTRGSPLALAQANQVKALLHAAHPRFADADITIHVVTTKGDRIQDRPLADLGGKGLFTEEIEAGLLDGTVDMAVHSMKDMPTVLPDGLWIDCILPREDVRDAFISPKAETLMALPAGSVVGTASLRRQAQVRRVRPDLTVESFRGNVDTRLAKLADGVVDATFLAMAGLNRLNKAKAATAPMDTDIMLPAIAQGAIGVETRRDDDAVNDLLAPLNHADTHICVMAERAFLAALDGSCRTPIAGLATLTGDTLSFRGEILSPDGSASFEATRTGSPSEAAAIGNDAGQELRGRAGPGFFG